MQSLRDGDRCCIACVGFAGDTIVRDAHLVASQADEYALESDQTKQRLLSFALVANGIEAF